MIDRLAQRRNPYQFGGSFDYGMLALVAALLIFFAPLSHAQTATPALEHHFAPDENLEKIDVAELAKARRSIDFAAYVLTDVAVIDALIAAAGRGVKVRIYRDGNFDRKPRGFVDVALARLAASKAIIRFKSDGAPLMHLKAYCVDGALLRTGSANFSASGLKRQDNDLLILRGPRACETFDRSFGRMFAQ
jgi:phosphatidylserine/phosphatidylglycerophosphate/cardiolipin synthase-like enzyme